MPCPDDPDAPDAATPALSAAALRQAAAELPDTPGVYVFHGLDERMPLYIGKSVNLRQRVLSHLRNPDEAHLLRQTRRISHIPMLGELGALLLEARLIKQQQPLLNQRLRRDRQLCAWQIGDGTPRLVHSKDADFALTPGLYGLFRNRHTAMERLRDLADAHRLCHAVLGLERLTPGRGCFRAALHRCTGVCRGDETWQAHQQRLLSALGPWQVAVWPHAGPVAVVERLGRQRQLHVVHRWDYLGSASTLAQARQLGRTPSVFDADTYRILCGPLLGQHAEVMPL